MAVTTTPFALRSPVFLPLPSSINSRFHGFNNRPPTRLSFPSRNLNSIRLTASASPSSCTPVTPIYAAAKSKTRSSSSTLTESTQSLATLAVLTIAVAKAFSLAIQTSSLGITDSLRFSLRTSGPIFFASLRDSPPGYLNTPLTVVAVGIKKWLEIYGGVLMVRVLLSRFPNIPWERQPLSAIRDLCDPYLNLFRNIIPPIFGTLDLIPLLTFAVLGTLASIVNGSAG